jgi:hypothetical protein
MQGGTRLFLKSSKEIPPFSSVMYTSKPSKLNFQKCITMSNLIPSYCRLRPLALYAVFGERHWIGPQKHYQTISRWMTVCHYLCTKITIKLTLPFLPGSKQPSFLFNFSKFLLHSLSCLQCILYTDSFSYPCEVSPVAFYILPIEAVSFREAKHLL